MRKFYVTVDHKQIGGQIEYSTSAQVEADGIKEAIEAVEVLGVRSGHEVTRVSAWPAEEDPAKS